MNDKFGSKEPKIYDFKIKRPLTKEEKSAFEIVQKLHKAGFEAYIAGGAVRDFYLKKEAHDIDIATSAKPEEIQKLFPSSYDRGKAFGVVAVRPGNKLPSEVDQPLAEDFEVATFRIDIGIADHRRPEQVKFTTAENDAQRRDFTINALFYDPVKEKIIDYVGGINDLENQLIRFVGIPRLRIEEDYLRMLRAIRFTHRLNFALDFEAALAIKKQAPEVQEISAERIRDELTNIITGPQREQALMQLESLGLLKVIVPEVVAMRGVLQPPEFHSEGDVWLHTLLAMESLSDLARGESEPSAELAWTVLLHDIGKPQTAGTRDRPGKTKIVFFEHEEKSAQMAREILNRLRFSKEFIDSCVWAISQHMRIMNAFRGMSERKQKKLFTDLNIDLLLALTRADLAASLRPNRKPDLSMYKDAVAKKEKFEKEADVQEKQQIQKFTLINGQDIMEILNIPSGPKVGEIKSKIEQAYLDGKISTREEALKMIQESKC